MQQSLPIQAALAFGWKAFKARPGFFIGITGLWLVIGELPTAVPLVTDKWAVFAVVNIIASVFSMLMTLGFIHLSLKIYRQQPILFGDLWSQTKLIWPYFLASLVYGVMLAVGFLLLIIPGIILALRYFYFSYVMVDKRRPVLVVLRQSARLTKGWTWSLFLFTLVQAAIVCLGILALGVGVLVAMPVVLLSEVYIYEFLLKQSTQPN